MADQKIKVATCSLGGCFGCHMSLLDIDEALIEVEKHVQFDRSPITDIKNISKCDLGLIEGGLCNEENVHVLKDFRENCKILVAVGACAINGGLPAMRNGIDVQDCLKEVYQTGYNLTTDIIPDDPEIPRLQEKVQPLHELVKVDYFLPGCPPPAPAFLELITALVEGREPNIDYPHRRFD